MARYAKSIHPREWPSAVLLRRLASGQDDFNIHQKRIKSECNAGSPYPSTNTAFHLFRGAWQEQYLFPRIGVWAPFSHVSLSFDDTRRIHRNGPSTILRYHTHQGSISQGGRGGYEVRAWHHLHHSWGLDAGSQQFQMLQMPGGHLILKAQGQEVSKNTISGGARR
jgi:hypothetical protein